MVGVGGCAVPEVKGTAKTVLLLVGVGMGKIVEAYEEDEEDEDEEDEEDEVLV